MKGAAGRHNGENQKDDVHLTRPPAPWRRLAVLAALMLAALTFNTAENLPVGLLDLIAEDLQVSLSAVGLLVTGYGVTVAVTSVPVAHLMRAVPRRHVLTALLGALVVSSLVAALAPSYAVLLGARLLTALAQALFWAVMGPVAVGLFAPGVRGRVVGRCPWPARWPWCSAFRPGRGWASGRTGRCPSPRSPLWGWSAW
ncbi:unnamed protein product [[Actinomadura] parvosata subsp. kistnae]|uniref:MFS transporter n=1 Tax=[Actinomadura] parvosata TaxID=1955412 RepID=UPI000D2EF6D8|nr:unnamed protein product [Actinomadura parvosata subsp. kistnae]